MATKKIPVNTWNARMKNPFLSIETSEGGVVQTSLNHIFHAFVKS